MNARERYIQAITFDNPDKIPLMPGYPRKSTIERWQKEGLPVCHEKAPFPLFRQIQIGAGALVLLGILGSYVWHPMFWLSAFVGAGLVFAGITGFCGLGLLLARMPWNKQ